MCWTVVFTPMNSQRCRMPLQASTVQFGDGVDHYKVTPLASERGVVGVDPASSGQYSFENSLRKMQCPVACCKRRRAAWAELERALPVGLIRRLECSAG